MRRAARGVSLIETVAAMVVLAVAAPACLWAVRDATVQRAGSALALRARCLAVEKIEDVVADRHSGTRGYGWVTNANYPAETAIADMPGFARSVEVVETGPQLSGAGTGYKVVTVTVSWVDPQRGATSMNLRTVVTDY